ncbi:MAG: RNA-binding S4 domain-containing protein [Burkholderiaceae bacterium]
MQTIDFELRGDHIALDALLKATGLAHSGGAARQLITDGQVRVDGQVELRKTAKMRAGQVVQFGDHQVMLAAGPPQGERSPLGGPTP